MQWVLKYVTPVYLLTIFVMFCWKNVPQRVAAISESPVALASVLFIATVLAFILVLVHIAGRRWAAEGRFDKLDNEVPRGQAYRIQFWPR